MEIIKDSIIVITSRPDEHDVRENMKSIYLGLGYSVLLDIVYSDFGLFMVKESILVLITDCDKEYFSPNKQTENLYYFLLKNENIKL